jgi:hypothetical protein
MTRFLKSADRRLDVALRWILAGCCSLILTSCGKAPIDSEKTAVRSQNKTAAATATNSTPAVTQVPRSMFSTNPTEGRDPFFPESTRRFPRQPEAQNLAAKPAPLPGNLLKLTGLWPNKKRPLALINRTSVGPGEEVAITVFVANGQNSPESRKVLIRCLEVRENSVLISINGEPGTKELTLQSRL